MTFKKQPYKTLYKIRTNIYVNTIYIYMYILINTSKNKQYINGNRYIVQVTLKTIPKLLFKLCSSSVVVVRQHVFTRFDEADSPTSSPAEPLWLSLWPVQ